MPFVPDTFYPFWLIGVIPSLAISGAAQSIPGLRHMPSRLQGELLQGLADAAGLGAGAAIDAVADDIADSLVTALLGAAKNEL